MKVNRGVSLRIICCVIFNYRRRNLNNCLGWAEGAKNLTDIKQDHKCNKTLLKQLAIHMIFIVVSAWAHSNRLDSGIWKYVRIKTYIFLVKLWYVWFYLIQISSLLVFYNNYKTYLLNFNLWAAELSNIAWRSRLISSWEVVLHISFIEEFVKVIII